MKEIDRCKNLYRCLFEMKHQLGVIGIMNIERIAILEDDHGRLSVDAQCVFPHDGFDECHCASLGFVQSKEQGKFIASALNGYINSYHQIYAEKEKSNLIPCALREKQINRRLDELERAIEQHFVAAAPTGDWARELVDLCEEQESLEWELHAIGRDQIVLDPEPFIPSNDYLKENTKLD